ncbi:hypothetical protein RSOLAG22IIIB_11123 [Rhizoctonia solani]|uniref:Uncharacterized protein n=1 Tax=Rhizoctonia solani TaxID=456999 RepID=A0A0K6G740_9AGAM|nr:hypothetical protein RSOLAG22IIIB_11123 [Rhizoctonia solani]
MSSSQSSALNSPTESDSSVESSAQDDPYLPKARATKHDKLVGKTEKVLSKIIRDPELHERAILRATGGKEAAEGLAVVDPNKI